MLTTVASFTEPWEAHLFRLRLEAEGIPAVVANEHHVWAMWPYALALGGVRVLVPRGLVEDARQVESSCRAGDYRRELEAELGPFEQPECPRCGSRRIDARRSLAQLSLLIASYLWAGVIFPWRARVLSCAECGAKWPENGAAPRS